MRLSWTLPLGIALAAPPAFSETLGYFPADDQLAAYDLEHGTLLWLADVHAVSQPVVGEGKVFVAETGLLTALDDQTGTVVWRLPMTEPLAGPLVWDNGWLMATTARGALLAFRARDGGLIWRRDIGDGWLGRPALAADRVFVPAEGRIIALQIETGEPVWVRRVGGRPSDILALDDRLFVGSTDNYFYCLNTFTGEISWRWATGADVVGLPMVDERRVYFASFDNVLRALDRVSGAQRWRRTLPLRPTRGPTRAGDALVVSGVSPTALLYWLKDGTPAGEVAAGGELAAGPHAMFGAHFPMMALVARDMAQGTIVRTVVRSFEPSTVAALLLPNSVAPPRPQAPQQEQQPQPQ